MQKMVAEIKAATAQASASDQKNQYEYDSDEEVDGGTWEHKARVKEMKFTEGLCVCVSVSCVKIAHCMYVCESVCERERVCTVCACVHIESVRLCVSGDILF